MANQNAEQIITNVIGVQPFSVSMLQLCQLSYYPFGQIRWAVDHLPPITSEAGTWSCIWGPAEDWSEANLAFIAAYTPNGASSPQFTAVVIRGTDITWWDPIGDAWQVWEDLDAPNPVAMPWDPSNPAQIAGGTCDGLSKIQGLVWEGTSLCESLAAFLAGPGNGSFVVVTGHSLGGCLTTVVAPWLLSELTQYSGSIVPVTFAAPTAGDPNFVSYFDSKFSYSLRYQNPLDIVPLAFYDLSGLEDIYASNGLLIPCDMYALVLCGEGMLDGLTYAQPLSNAPALGQIWDMTTSWFDEAAFQHHTDTYMQLLGGTSFGTPPSRKRSPQAEEAIRRRLGPLKARVQRMRTKA
jgi:lipase (class 3)